MSVLKVENLSKQYRLGTVGSKTLRDDMARFWANVRGKEDPTAKIGEVNDRTTKGESDYVWALKDINFEVKQGEILGIIGKNGAGKSTLLKILSKVTGPTTGRIRAKGRIAALLEVGTGFHPELTGRENIYLNGAILGMTRAEITAKLEEIVEFAGVAKYLDTPVKRYSSGMTVRLGFAVAAHLEPEILIVDEVLAVGDAEFQKKAIGKMKDVSKGEGRTVLFVSHNMAAVSSLCTRSLLLEQGGVKFIGSTPSTLEAYLNSGPNNLQNNSIENQLKKLPADINFALKKIEVTQKGKVKQEFNNNEAINIIFEYEVQRPTIGLRIGFDLVDQETNTIIFRTFHDDNSKTVATTMPNKYFTEFHISENFFKDTHYTIIPIIGIHKVRWIINSEVKLPIKIINISGINRQYHDKRPGLIMPYIYSNTERIDISIF